MAAMPGLQLTSLRRDESRQPPVAPAAFFMFYTTFTKRTVSCAYDMKIVPKHANRPQGAIDCLHIVSRCPVAHSTALAALVAAQQNSPAWHGARYANRNLVGERQGEVFRIGTAAIEKKHNNNGKATG